MKTTPSIKRCRPERVPRYIPATAQGCDNHIYCNRNYLKGWSLDTKNHDAAVYFNCYTTLIWLLTWDLSSWESLGQRLGQGLGGGQQWWEESLKCTRDWIKNNFSFGSSWVSHISSCKSEILHVKKAVKRFLPFCYPTYSKDTKEKKNCPLWKGKVRMGQSRLYFMDTYPILLPITGFKKHLPWVSGMLVSMTALSDLFYEANLACIHIRACSMCMCNISRYTHTSRHT